MWDKGHILSKVSSAIPSRVTMVRISRRSLDPNTITSLCQTWLTWPSQMLVSLYTTRSSINVLTVTDPRGKKSSWACAVCFVTPCVVFINNLFQTGRLYKNKPIGVKRTLRLLRSPGHMWKLSLARHWTPKTWKKWAACSQEHENKKTVHRWAE